MSVFMYNCYFIKKFSITEQSSKSLDKSFPLKGYEAMHWAAIQAE